MFPIRVAADLHIFEVCTSTVQRAVIQVSKALCKYFGDAVRFPEGDERERTCAGFFEKHGIPGIYQ